MKKINLAISGCMGKMGQQLIKSSKKDKNFKSFNILFCVSSLNLKYLLEPPIIKLIVFVFFLFKSKLIL